MRISDWSSDVCSSDLRHRLPRLSTSEPPRKITNRKISITEDFWGILLQIIPVIIHEAAVVHFIDNLIKFNLGQYRMVVGDNNQIGVGTSLVKVVVTGQIVGQFLQLAANHTRLVETNFGDLSPPDIGRRPG